MAAAGAPETIDKMMARIRDDLAALNGAAGRVFSERSPPPGSGSGGGSHNRGAAPQGLIYEGRLPPPKASRSRTGKDREQTLFRATQFGDDVDRSATQIGRQLHLFAPTSPFTARSLSAASRSP